MNCRVMTINSWQLMMIWVKSNGPVGQNLTLSRYNLGGIRSDKKSNLLHREKKSRHLNGATFCSIVVCV